MFKLYKDLEMLSDKFDDLPPQTNKNFKGNQHMVECFPTHHKAFKNQENQWN
jgi:hypothetical protein